jgi:hypothetical protein
MTPGLISQIRRMLGQYSPLSTYQVPSAPILTVPIPNLPVTGAEKASAAPSLGGNTGKVEANIGCERRVATSGSVSRADWSVDSRGGPTVATKDYPIPLGLAVTQSVVCHSFYMIVLFFFLTCFSNISTPCSISHDLIPISTN